jgi:DNA-binding phage protein
MSKHIKVADLPEFDATPYLDSEAAIAAYFIDILEANDAALLASALGDIAPLTKHCVPIAPSALTQLAGSVRRSGCVWWLSPCMSNGEPEQPFLMRMHITDTLFEQGGS